jgi:hypothetical protein
MKKFLVITNGHEIDSDNYLIEAEDLADLYLKCSDYYGYSQIPLNREQLKEFFKTAILEQFKDFMSMNCGKDLKGILVIDKILYRGEYL